jgi:hypothetical protein
MNDRDTTVPEPAEPLTEPPPPWERGTAPGHPAAGTFNQTQPISPPTVEDVLEVFARFQGGLLDQIDKRDKRILMAIRDIGSDIMAHHARETARGDEHARRIAENERWTSQLRRRTHKLSGDQQVTDLRLAEIERRLGIEPPPAPIQEPEPELEPELEG